PRQRVPAVWTGSCDLRERLRGPRDPRLLVRGSETARIFVPLAVRGDLVAARHDLANALGPRLGHDRGRGERRGGPRAVERIEHPADSDVHAVLGVLCREVFRSDAIGPTGRAQIDGDEERARRAVRPLDAVERPLVAGGVAILPRHGSITSGAPKWPPT